MKKVICLFLPLVIVFGICACSDYRTNNNFLNNEALAEAYNKILFIDSDLAVLDESYDIAAPDLKDAIGDLLDMKTATDKACTADKYLLIIGIFDKLCENAEKLKDNMALYEEGKAELDTELIKATEQNCKDFEKVFLGKKQA